MTGPVFRFAPSPNGRLHLGHAYSALLNADLARRSGGQVLLRIEDIDPARSRPELIAAIADDLSWLGVSFDGPVRRQSAHLPAYAAAIRGLAQRGLAYPCFCSRGDVAADLARIGGVSARDPDGTPLYPGTCRHRPVAEVDALRAEGRPHTWRLHLDRALAMLPGPHVVRGFDAEALSAGGGETTTSANPARWGDAVIARRDVPTSYHLAVVMDDHAQGVTHVVRGADLLAATDLHVLLQGLLGCDHPAYHHHALIRDPAGHKLSKSRGSESLADLRSAGLRPDEIRRRLGFG